MQPFYARSQSDPPQAVELWFEDQEQADQAFTRASREQGLVTDGRGRRVLGLAIDAGCHPEEEAALRCAPDMDLIEFFILGWRICCFTFSRAGWHPGVGINVLGMLVRCVLYGVWCGLALAAKFLALAFVYPLALLVVQVVALLRRVKVISSCRDD